MRFASRFLAAVAALGLVAAFSGQPAQAQQVITLNGAVQFNDDHAFTKTMVNFEELVKKYYGKPVNFVLHKNSELGLACCSEGRPHGTARCRRRVPPA